MSSNRFGNGGFLSLVLATLIFIAGVFAFKLSIDEYNAQKEYPVTQHHTEDEVAREATVIGVGAEGWTAIFTGGLFVFTMALAIFTYRLFRVTRDGIAEQAAMTRESLSTAERSALAAERALEGADAPFISAIVDLNAVRHSMMGGYVSVQYRDQHRMIIYRFTNFGKSPATILEVYAGLAVSNASPQAIVFPPPQSNLYKVEIVGPDKETLDYAFSREAILAAGGGSHDEWEDPMNNKTLWVAFQVRYRDALGSQFVSGQTFAFNAKVKMFYPQGGTRHNYRRKLTDDELADMETRDAL